MVGFVLFLLFLFFVAIPFGIAIAVRAHLYRQAERGELPPARGRTTRRSTGIGQAAMKGYRAYGDAKAIARGTYGKRLIRRAAIRGIRKL